MSSLSGKLRTLAGLSLVDWLLLPQLVAASLVLQAGLRLVSLPRITAWLNEAATMRPLRWFPLPHTRIDLTSLMRLAYLATRITAGQRGCLPRSLLLLWLVHARGSMAQLLIGVNTNLDQLRGHAWVETDGLDNEGADVAEQFPPLLRP